MSTPEDLMVDNFKKLQALEKLVNKYIASVPKTRKTKDIQLEAIEKEMNEIKGKLKLEANRRSYNDFIDKLDKYENSEIFRERYKDKSVKPKHKLEKIDVFVKVKEEEKVKEEVKKIEERMGGAGTEAKEVEERKESEEYGS